MLLRSILLFCIAVTSAGARDLSSGSCPHPCTCQGLTISCSHLGLTSIPRNIPAEAERL